MLYLTGKVIQAYHNNGFISCMIMGEQAAGKTSYALHIAREIYNTWDRVLDHLYFDPDEAMNTFEKYALQRKRLPLVIMDDAGLWLSSLRWYEEDIKNFLEFYNIMRSVAAGVIFTSVDLEDLPKRLWKKIWYRAEVITEEDNKQCKAVVYRVKARANLKAYLYHRAIDYFPRHYPNWLYERYEVLRNKAVINKIRQYKKRKQYQHETVFNRKRLHDRVVELYKEGYNKTEIARKLGISRSTVYGHLRKEGLIA